MQLTLDAGSEIGIMRSLQADLRYVWFHSFYCGLTTVPSHPSGMLEEEFPSSVIVKSTHNIIIEGLWKWFRQQRGKNIKEFILDGKRSGLFNPVNQLHMYVVHRSSIALSHYY
jgi:hypothetical protein